MKVFIDGRMIKNESDLHLILSSKLDFGPYYGKNLDALWDSLSDVERPVELIWQYEAATRKHLGSELFDKVVHILQKMQDYDISCGWQEKFSVVIDE